MLKEPIAINNIHKFLLDDYLQLIDNTVKTCAKKNTSKYSDFIDLCNIVIEHHNGYKQGKGENNFYDFLAVIPTNLSIMTNGFLAGMENKRNAKELRICRLMLTEYSHELVSNLEKLKPTDE